MLITRPLRELRERGAAVVARRIRRDARRVSEELRPVLEHVAARFYDVDLTLDAMEREGVVDWRLRERFRDEMAMAIKPYLLELKADLARWLLLETDLLAKHVAALLGYSLPYNFNRDFKSWTGETPAAFRAARRRWSTARRGDKRAARRRRLCERLEIELPSAEPPDVEALAEGKLFVFVGGEHGEEVAELLWELLREEVPSRQRRLLRHDVLFGGPELFELLSRKSREIGRRNRKRGVAIAELALAAVEGSAALLGEQWLDLLALALARRGNALRLAGRLDDADEAFREAREVWAGPGGMKDRRVEAELTGLEGTLRLFQRRFDEALGLLDHSIGISREIADVELQVRLLLQRIAVWWHLGSYRKMIPDLGDVEQLLGADPTENRRLLLGVYQESALVLFELGNVAGARKYLLQAKTLCEKLADPMSGHQIRWIEGRVAGTEEDHVLAERLFRQARVGFLDLGDEVTAALVSVDLAILCHYQGRFQEVMALVIDDVLPALAAVRLHKETLAARKLLHEAVAGEAISLNLLWQAREVLRKTQRAPGRILGPEDPVTTREHGDGFPADDAGYPNGSKLGPK